MNYKAFTQFAIDLLPAKLCNCTQAIMTHIITSFLAFMFFLCSKFDCEIFFFNGFKNLRHK
ncbi:hypothetical protein [Escherichia coli]|uniref:hypothetical protein n=1 Tax=Escherichia coli TaxID=562 RepID=UPI003CCAD36C